MNRNVVQRMPRAISERIMRRAAEGGPLVLVVDKAGKPSRVYRYAEYQKMQKLPGEVQPWKHKKSAAPVPDPLGSVDGKPVTSLSRDVIYE